MELWFFECYYRRMSSITQDQLVEMYSSGKSMRKIASELNCSENTVVYWMNKYGIRRRNRSEAGYFQQNPSGDPFSIKNTFELDDFTVYGLGIGIYWGEGDKTSKHAVRVANTDPGLIRVFVKFLRQICRVREDKILYSIVSFHDSDIEVVRSFWSRELLVLPEKFGTIVQISPQGKGIYKRKSLYGVCTVHVGNIKLKKWILGEVERFSLPG